MGFEHISSRRNKLIREAAALAASAERRRGEARFLCEGARLCEDAARSGVQIDRCFFTEQAQRRYGEYLNRILPAAQEQFLVEEHVADLLSSTRNSQGIFCVCETPENLKQGKQAFSGACAVLENLQDPGNLGTVLRTAEALGIGCVFLLGDCCDPLSPKVLRASMGAVFRISVVAETSPVRLRDLLKRRGYTLYAAVPDAAASPVTAIDFSEGLHAVLIGNEGNGLTKEAVALCGIRLTIPMAGRAESLNASAAATILLWEMNRGAGY